MTNSMTNSLILIAEDEPDISNILDAYLTLDGFRTYRVADGQAVLDVQPHLQPDLIMLDVKLPHRSGWDVLAELRRRGNTPVVLLAAFDRDLDRLQALRSGADDYIVKPFNPAEVVARLRAILRRSNPPPTTRMLRVGDLEIDTESYLTRVRTRSAEVPITLTLTEFRLLAHMARSPSRVFTRGELLDACMADTSAMERTIDSHICRLRKKLEQAGAPGMPEVMRGVGYRLRGAQ
ncbi:Phosphate regulon transcriptional regulatory protein phoB,DNA-binding response regulator CreB,Response regulator of citrate/malate metabolism,phosphate regulon transcriptional regulatory protein PhoB,Response regulator receiver domain [Burkholderia stabilis]|uniref:DNA-binding response regulator n=2 Tax=Burkholderia stabilis TaxID=95485 RepID=A0AAJ5NHS8_9BURK|nr:Phosphate regulon transcriptional regulatory protein phoB,DNA-binding response regulator CreB,Response regulator of citrate/malate metabolism,phosphate regulon transcriptional regulatory protein PhoB,Response regulator receiver domain [Burkholderia stabilis]